MILVCHHCSGSFTSDKRGRKFCSMDCKVEAQTGGSLPSKGKLRPNTRKAEVRSCKACGAEFRAVNDYAGKRPQAYCSAECWRKDVAVPEKTCLCCGGSFKTDQREKVYCGIKCRDRHYRVRLKGEASHLWEGGKTAKNKLMRCTADYRVWRKAVFERDDYTCVQCGARSAAGNPVELHHDHIAPLSERPELAYEVSNGRTLCTFRRDSKMGRFYYRGSPCSTFKIRSCS